MAQNKNPEQTRSLPGGTLQSRFLESLDASEQKRIFGLVEPTAQALEEWATRYPLIRRVRILPLVLSVAAAAPFSAIQALISAARVSLWIFTLDDLFDEEALPKSDLMEQADQFCAIVHGQHSVSKDDSLASALSEIRLDLASYPLFKSLEAVWAKAFCGTIDEMKREYYWRMRYRQEGASMLPTYEEYLECGRYSIGGPPHVWSTLITIGDLSTPHHLEHLGAMEQHASICIRLANDLRSYVKELAEGKINSLLILSHRYQQENLPLAAAQQKSLAHVRADIAQGLHLLEKLQTNACTKSGQPEAAVADIARFVCDFYTHHDYHTFVE